MKIVTALADPIICEELKKETLNEILNRDIQYQEGIFEVLEQNKKAEILLLNSKIIKKNEIEEVLNKIKNKYKKINIIIFLENKNNKIIDEKNIKRIFYNNKKEIKKILTEEIKKIEYKKNNKETNEKNRIKSKKTKESKEAKIITVLGTRGIGKTIFSAILSKTIINKKILLADFDFFNNNLHTVFGIKKTNNKLKINKNIEILSGTDILFKKNKINNEEIKQIIEKEKNKYDYIIIDTTSECFFDLCKTLINLSDENIFLIEPNILEIKKSRKLLNIYIKNWEIEKEIKIIINKWNKNSVDTKILKNMFSEFKIIGKIKLNDYYNLYINSNFKINNNKTKKEYQKILENLNIFEEV